MKQCLNHFFFRTLIFLTFLFFFISCSAVDQAIRPDEKTVPPSWPSYDQILKENYKGPRARVVVTRFIDQSARGKETSQLADGITEMLGNALVATNRYIVTMGKSLEDILRHESNRSHQLKKEERFDLLIEGTIIKFKPGIAGAGEREEASYLTLMIKVINPRTNQELATERIRGKASDFEMTSGKGGLELPKVFKDLAKTPMEKAIRIAIEESASFIVAKTPPESYAVLPPVAQKEIPKPSPTPPPEIPKITAPPPPPSPPLPTLRVTQVVWSNVNLREGPGLKYKVIGNAKKGAPLKILELKGDWLHVQLENGNEAWVSRLATSEASPPPSSPSPPKLSPM